MIGVDGSVVEPPHAADHPDAERAQDEIGRVEAARRIVVTPDDDDLQAGQTRHRAPDEVVQLLLRARRRIGRVEDVAGDEQHVHRLVFQGLEQPRKKLGVLELAIVVVQRVTEVPIRRVQQAHRGRAHRPVHNWGTTPHRERQR
jgi:hypothetical protein